MPSEFGVKLRDLVTQIKMDAREIEVKGGSEEDLKQRIEQILRSNVWDSLGVPPPSYEYPVGKGAVAKTHGRVDALYGLVIFEYKKPGELERTGARDEAVKKMVNEYIPGLLKDSYIKSLMEEVKRSGHSPRIVGVIWDGYSVVFLEYNPEDEQTKIDPRVGQYELNIPTMRRIVRAVIATYKKRLDAGVIASDFGYKSDLVERAGVVKTLYMKLESPTDKTRHLYEEWLKLTSQAFAISGTELSRLADSYGFSPAEAERVDGLKLFFAIQTYYALVIKLLSVEVAARFYDSTVASFFEKMRSSLGDSNQLKRNIRHIEGGSSYAWYGIRNFLEGEFFSWYLEEWDDDVADAIRQIVERLLEYDVESLILDPSAARDMFKLLYEELIPRKEVRKKLGIYTTPDWLAEMVLHEIDLEGLAQSKGKKVSELRILDPGCGTGTFLTLAIKILSEYAMKEGYSPREALRIIRSNVIGFDIDSLAVLTARANYLLALAASGLLEHKGDEELEIPVYLANSVITASELKDRILIGDEQLDVVKVETSVGDFLIPLRFVENGDVLLMLSRLREYIESEVPFEAERVQEIARRYVKSAAELDAVRQIYERLVELKKMDIDGIWVPIIKSHVVSTYFRGFDCVVGNPPWLPFRHITSTAYQDKVKEIMKDTYQMVVDEHLMPHIEMATLFFVRCVDLYLSDGGVIGFVMPKSVLYADQHDRFRRGSVSVEFSLIKVIDCRVQPLFYVPTCVIIASKSSEGMKSPVPVVFVSGKLPKTRHKVMSLSEAEKLLEVRRGQMHLNLVVSRSFFAPVKLSILGGRSAYYGSFYQGATIVPQPCWFVDVVDDTNPKFYILRTSRRAKVRAHSEHEIGPLPVEKDFLFRVLTSAEVLPFCHLEPNYAVLPVRASGKSFVILDKEKARSSGEIYLVKWLEAAEKIWDIIRGEKKKKMDLYNRLDYQHTLTKQNPRASYKVVYLTSATNLASCVVKNKPTHIFVESTLYRYETNDADEAYYLTAILNSSLLDTLIKPMQSKGYGGVERHIHKKPLEFPIPKFSRKNTIHRQLSELGMRATAKAFKILPELLERRGYGKKLEERGTLVPMEVATLRGDMREELSEELDKINEIVVELFSDEGMKKATSLDEF
jgi:SAM-dependent methyltransferase